MLTRAAIVAVAGLLTVGTAALPAAAADDPVDVTKSGRGGGGRVEVIARQPGHAGSTSGGTTAVGFKEPGERACAVDGVTVDCQSERGVWNEEQKCWVQRMSPQPPASDPIWNGRTEGAIYWATCPDPTGLATIGGDHMFWAPSPGAAGAPVLVDPVTLAEEAIERMHLVGANVGATPLNGGDGIVGLQTWLWVANGGPSSMGPISRTASAGSVSVTATAHVTQVEWDMGNGDVTRCSNAGTEWRPGLGTGNSPTCGYTYYQDSGAQPGGTFKIRPTTYWQVDWAGAGQSGVIGFTLSGGELPMAVVELQAPRVG